MISRRHAEVSHSDGLWWIADLGSRNGTLVDGQRVTRIPLPPSCEVRLYETAPVLRIEVRSGSKAATITSFTTVFPAGPEALVETGFAARPVQNQVPSDSVPGAMMATAPLHKREHENRMPGRIGFEVDFSRSSGAPARRGTRHEQFRILIMGDFSGRGQGATDPQATSSVRTMAVDLDSFDATLARCGPKIRLGVRHHWRCGSRTDVPQPR
jgi:hypothetical protein